MTTSGDLWRVQLRTGELRVLTLDGLDEAFQAGVIDASTSVLAPGATTWAPLGEVAGLEGESHDASNHPARQPTTPSLSPVAISSDQPPHAPARPGIAVPDLAELSEDALRPKRGRGALFGGLAAAAAIVGGIAFGLPKLGAALGNVHPAKDGATANAVQAPAGAMELPDPNQPKAQLSEEQRKKLLEADKKREEERRAKQPQAAPRGRPAPRAKSASPFINGGDKYDPLNGSL